MEKDKIKEIETQKPEELWGKFHDQDSKEDLWHVFDDIMRKLMLEPNLYYMEDHEGTVTVIQRSDKKIIYGTADPAEIETLKKIGVEE